MASSMEGTTVIPIIEDDKNTYYNQLIFPIVITGEKEGVLILCDGKNSVQFDKSHIIALNLISKFLSKQME